MPFNRRIGRRLQWITGAVAGTVLAAALWSTYQGSRAELDLQTHAKAVVAIRSAVREIDDFVLRVGMIPRALALRQQVEGTAADEALVEYVRQAVAQAPEEELYGLYMTFEDREWTDPASEVWVDRETWPGRQKLDYDFHDPQWDWYHGPKTTGKFYVTDPYFDDGGSNITMVSLSAPVYGDGGRFLGVAGADLSIDRIREIVSRIYFRLHPDREESAAGAVGAGADYAYLVSRAGRILVHPDAGLMLRRGFEGAPAAELPEGALVAARPAGEARITVGGDRRHLFWATSDVTAWKLVFSVSEAEALRPARQLMLRSAAIGTAGLVAMIALVAWVGAKVTQPIGRLAQAASEVARGDYSAANVDPLTPRADELGELARSFKGMAGEIRAREERLEAWNRDLESIVERRTAELARAVETAELARAEAEEANRGLQAELAEAARYVRSTFPAPATEPLRIDWHYRPSSELGGDAFGYHAIDGDHFAVYLLDVCGHGVGAALLAVTAINVIRSGSLPSTDLRDPGAVIAALNRAFPMERHNDMYFTLWYGVYHAPTRALRYASGGHPPALLLTRADDGSTRSQRLHSVGLAVGAMDGIRYRSEECLVPDDALLLVPCDGCYEIRRPDGTMVQFDEFEAFLRARGAAPNGLHDLLDWAQAEHGKTGLDDDFSIVRVAF